MRCSPPRFIGPTAALLALTSCQVGPTLSERLHAYIGQPEQAIVQGLGVPARSITTGGITYLAYVWQNTEVIPGDAGFGWGGDPWGPWGGGFYAPPTVVVTGCEATFQMGPSGQAPGQTGGGEVAVAVVLRGNACQ